ncbi:MAG: T9SS type A sorting domain-containing protein [Elusimicrobia bacterium]|nr:T9SS type A sorting domain-containing protein [Elusimicrobiota bacterium]
MTVSWLLPYCLAVSGAFAAPIGLADVQVFPIPWKPGTGDAPFDAPFVTFARMPPRTEVSIYTLRGQRLWSGVADASGTLRWSGVNQSGRPVASGTYLALIDGGGRKTTRRVVLVR